MLLTTIDRDHLSPELQERLACFELNKDAYITLQNQYTEVVQENQRLTEKADDFDKQANRTDSSWSTMGKSGTIEQSKINDEIERSAQLRNDAQSLRLTATARAVIQKDLVVKVAGARLKLVGIPDAINKELQQNLLDRALNQDGTRDTLLELFILCRAVILKSLGDHDVVLSRCNSLKERETKIQELTWMALGKKLEILFDGSENETLAPTLVAMPPPVQKEVVVNRTSDYLKLRRENTDL